MESVLERLLACPRCYGKIASTVDRLRCTQNGCGFVASVKDGIVNVVETETASFFDSKVPVMLHGADEPGSYTLFYDQQSRVAEGELQDARIIIDVGCGPRLMYKRSPGALVIGVDLSYESLRHNTDVDVRVFGSATRLPVAENSVDAVVCFYLLHHLVAGTQAGNRGLLRAAFLEFARVLRPGGDLLVFEVTPWWPVWAAQRAAWDVAKRVLGSTLDMFFWTGGALVGAAGACLPQSVGFRHRTFRVPRWTMFPPAFAVQRIRIPRLFYPFDICMYQWRMPERKHVGKVATS